MPLSAQGVSISTDICHCCHRGGWPSGTLYLHHFGRTLCPDCVEWGCYYEGTCRDTGKV